MRDKLIVSLCFLIATFVLADSKTNGVAYVLNLAEIPYPLCDYVEENPEGFVTNMNILMSKGYSESNAMAEIEHRIVVHLATTAQEEKNAQFKIEVSKLSAVPRAEALKNPNRYRAAKKRFKAGTESPGDLWILGVEKGAGGLYRTTKNTSSEHLCDEIGYRNSAILFSRKVAEIKVMRKWLKGNCPPWQLPPENLGYMDASKAFPDRVRLVEIENSRIAEYYKYYNKKAKEWASLQQRITSLEGSLRRLRQSSEESGWISY